MSLNIVSKKWNVLQYARGAETAISNMQEGCAMCRMVTYHTLTACVVNENSKTCDHDLLVVCRDKELAFSNETSAMAHRNSTDRDFSRTDFKIGEY